MFHSRSPFRLFRDLRIAASRCTAALAALLVAGHALAADAATTAPTRQIDVNGARIAYRDLGPRNGVPLLLLNRFRGTMDNWDPKFIDAVAAQRRVVMFDQPGFARSTGTPPDTLRGFADSAVDVAKALGIHQFDLLGFSMGGTVALQLLLDHSASVRRAVIAASGPGFVPPTPDQEATPAAVWPTALRPVNTDEDFLYLFFEPTSSSQQAGREYLARLTKRKDAFAAQVGPAAWQAQLKSAGSVHEASTSLLPRLSQISQPVLVANGRHDIMVPTYASYAMAQQLPKGLLLVYPDSGHGFLFQYPEDFARQVLDFLR